MDSLENTPPPAPDPAPAPLADSPESEAQPGPPATTWDAVRSNAWVCALLAVLGTGAVGCGLMWISVGVFQSYGVTVFCFSPALCSFLAIIFYNWARPDEQRKGIASMAGIVVGVLAVGSALLLLVASGGEGFICILMALPFAFVLALVGALVGQAVVPAVARRPHPLPVFAVAVLLYPLAQGYETAHPAPALPRLVVTQLVVAAPPARVWAALLQPTDYPAVTGLFRAGVVYPVRTEFAQAGRAHGPRTLVCRYSQGVARLPVVGWVPGRSLTFAVPAPDMPAPMHELSPYPSIHAPHLHGYFQVDSGTFRLRPLPGGRTLLEARTVYRHSIGPQFYWHLWSDYLLDAMHQRVLATLKARAEAAPALAQTTARPRHD
ncbi:SRPBCC family protein [Hymenobacter caeli]|uniref:SRPBCC family protein n=1 Tax=Hymenobacter caeli TaxID=2735894 RepID=A0ABX2FQG2_9BACT|nr:SRPBCC family protein [Hymenobacter caeli]NRT19392.1 hypothetical protein [Hymenobacter caeli]